MPKKTIKKSSKGIKKVKLMIDQTDLYKIEETPPKAATKPSKAEMTKRISKLDSTVKKVLVGQAFIVPKEERAWVMNRLAVSYPDRIYRATKIDKDSKFIRIIYKA